MIKQELIDALNNGNLLGLLTVTPLGAGGDYTSNWIQHVIPGGSSPAFVQFITGQCASDQSGTLYVDYSFDGTNVVASESIALTGGTPIIFDRKLRGFYVRLRYVNGATAQTVFVLGARLTVN